MGEGVRPVVVVGAGLAGLCCALHLERRGVAVRLLEREDRVGGVVRTDAMEGFRLDRGFQVLQTAYPEARCMLDSEALDLRPFHAGALVWSRGRLRRMGDPFRRPQDAFATLASGIPTLRDGLCVARLRRRVRRASLEEIFTKPARSTREALREHGFSERIVEHFFRPFYRGVFLEPDLATSSRLFEFTFRMFASGDVAIPAAGMEAIPRQLAARLREGTLRTGQPVRAVDDGGVTLDSGERLEAAAVVVATSASAAARLLPELPARPSQPVLCAYFEAPHPPVEGPWLILNGDDPGPVSHLCVPSEVAPSTAPAGRALVSVSVLGEGREGDAELFDAVRGQLGRWFGREVASWRPLRLVRVPEALPRQTPELFEPSTRPVTVGGRRFVCGGHRESASIGGAMRSGRRAARAVHSLLRGVVGEAGGP